MADTKISALAAAASLADADVLAGVQSATNKKFALSDIKDYVRDRRDVLINSNVRTSLLLSSPCMHPVRTAAGTWYVFIEDQGNSDFYYVKTTNYGATWSAPVLLKATTGFGLAVWFDKWTPGDAGTKIHLAYMESAAHDVLYRSLDTASDTLNTEAVIFAGASAVVAANTCLSITKAKGGQLYCMFDIDAGTEVGFYVSSDGDGQTWAAADGSGVMTEGASDYFLLFPGNYADTADIDCVYWDRSADTLSLKVFDASASAMASETTISASMTDIAPSTSSTMPQFAGAVRNSDGHLMFVAWSNADTLNATLRFWDINGAASLPGTPVTINTSTDDQGGCAIGVNSTNDDLYVFYLGKTDGSETYTTALNVYYKISTDDGATWGSETQLSTAARDLVFLSTSQEFALGDFATIYAGGAATAGLPGGHFLYCSSWR